MGQKRKLSSASRCQNAKALCQSQTRSTLGENNQVQQFSPIYIAIVHEKPTNQKEIQRVCEISSRVFQAERNGARPARRHIWTGVF